jgi:glycosyltransferase involved in cell wall biosynthesis
MLTYATGRPVATGGMIDAFFEQEFDVTHFHNVSLVGGPGILSKGSGVRLYTAHEHWLVCPTHILWRHNREPCVGRECVRCQLAYKRPPQPWRYTGLLEREARSIDAFIALSRSTADNHREFGFPFDMQVLPSFLPNAATTKEPPPAGRPYALFVGRLEKLKGLQDLIPVFSADPSIDLVVVGEGDYGEELRKLAGGSPHIRFLGRLTPEELEPLYAGAAAVVMPSVCHEVFPLVALEAFRAGAPIVARNLGPFPEIIEASGAGYLFDDPAEAHHSVRRLAADGVLRREFAEKAKRAVEVHWSERVAMAAYFNLVAEKAAARGMERCAETARALASF